MANFLRNMLIDRVALVDRGANPRAHILIRKAERLPGPLGERLRRALDASSAAVSDAGDPVGSITKDEAPEDKGALAKKIGDFAEMAFPSLTREQAIAKLTSERPDLAERYEKAEPATTSLVKNEPAPAVAPAKQRAYEALEWRATRAHPTLSLEAAVARYAAEHPAEAEAITRG
jgi:hypothetical protein